MRDAGAPIVERVRPLRDRRPASSAARCARGFLPESPDVHMISACPDRHAAGRRRRRGVAVLASCACRSILGYVAAGLAIGPWGLNLVGDVSRICAACRSSASCCCCSSSGSSCSRTRLWVMRRARVRPRCCAGARCARCCWAQAPGRSGSRRSPPASSASGCRCPRRRWCCSCSPSASQLKTQYGRATFGILLFQDLAVLPVLAVLPLLLAAGRRSQRRRHLVAGAAEAAARDRGGGWRAGGWCCARRCASSRGCRCREVFTAAALLTVIATALLANLVGLSASLGAFLAGVLLADSEFRHELEADLEPFKGLLLGLFFIVGRDVGEPRAAALRAADAARRHRRIPGGQGPRGDRARRGWQARSAGVGAATGVRAADGRRVRLRAVHARRAASGCSMAPPPTC